MMKSLAAWLWPLIKGIWVRNPTCQISMVKLVSST